MRRLPLALAAALVCSCAADRAAPDAAADSGVVAPADAATLADAATPADAASGGPHDEACLTHYLDPRAYLAGSADPQWYVDNIPFLDVPDSITGTHIGPVYYYRWSTLKRALRYTDAANGYVFLEFLEPPAYAAAFGAVNAAAAHHLYEARWLHNLRYADDYVAYWLGGAGKPNVRQYSFWVADSLWARYQVTGDGAFTRAWLPALESNYDAWADHFNPALGLYWQVPVWDAMEYTAATYSAQNPDGDPYHGGPGYRPTINAYQYADARAIAHIAGKLAGDAATAATYDARAAALVTALQSTLWSPAARFFVHKYRDGAGASFRGREEIGFVPWQFEMPASGFETAWQDTITNPAVFQTGYGPTTVEKSNAYYLYSYQRGACCHWNGPLWPYATTQTLVAMANLIDDYQQPFVDRNDYFRLLESFARSQYKNGEPYIAEALDPDDSQGAPLWAYDSPAHSEHYNHSGFVDPVISGLIGLRPSDGDVVTLRPLTPAAWDHFMLENVLYHGHYLTMIWDADGSHYHAGSGFTLIQDCGVLQRQASLGAMSATLAHGTRAPSKPPRRNNLFANPAGAPFPKASASYTFGVDNITQLDDGIILYDRSVNGSANNAAVHNRWTNYASPNAADWVQIDLGAPARLSEVTLHVYDDGKGVVPPLEYAIETSLDGSQWSAAAHLQKSPAAPAAGPNLARFDATLARYLRVTFLASAGCAGGSGCVGLTELESWVDP
jgi:hypothetical protein